MVGVAILTPSQNPPQVSIKKWKWSVCHCFLMQSIQRVHLKAVGNPVAACIWLKKISDCRCITLWMCVSFSSPILFCFPRWFLTAFLFGDGAADHHVQSRVRQLWCEDGHPRNQAGEKNGGERSDSFHVLLENNGVIMMSIIIIIIIFFLFRNARSALSWVPPSAVRLRPVWRPTTITAACRTKPSTLKTWHVASTSKLPLFKHNQSFLNKRRLYTTYIPMYCNYIIINLTQWQLWLLQLYFLNCSFYNNFLFKKKKGKHLKHFFPDYKYLLRCAD